MSKYDQTFRDLNRAQTPSALALLENPDSNEFQAEKVIKLLNTILKGIST